MKAMVRVIKEESLKNKGVNTFKVDVIRDEPIARIDEPRPALDIGRAEADSGPAVVLDGAAALGLAPALHGRPFLRRAQLAAGAA